MGSEGKVTTHTVPMGASEGVALDGVVITVSAKKDSETALLLDQKKATTIKTSIIYFYYIKILFEHKNIFYLASK